MKNRIVVVGNVDDGKSTLVGRILFDTRQILDDHYAAIERASQRKGLDAIDLTLLTDGLRAERDQGVTIDVAYRHCYIKDKRCLLIDAPGHLQYTQNMFTGTTQADCALILVDVTRGLTEQTFRHMKICSMLQVKSVVVALNKMDLVQYSEEAFRKFVADFSSAIDSTFAKFKIIPICALSGDNVLTKSNRMSWYSEGTLYDTLYESLSEDTKAGHVILPIQNVELVPTAQGRPDRWMLGRLWNGGLRVGDTLKVQPQNFMTRVSRILKGGEEVTLANSGDSVAIQFSEDLETSRGDVITDPESPIRGTSEFDAEVFWFSNHPSVAGKRYLVECGRAKTQGQIETVSGHFDFSSFRTVESTEPLNRNSIGQIRVSLADQVAVSSNVLDRRFGVFALIDPQTNELVAGGVVRD